MKKILSLSAIFLFTLSVCTHSLAQSKKKKSSSTQGLTISGRGGLGICNLSTSQKFEGFSFSAGLGILLGGVVEYRPKGSLGLLAGLAYDNKGASIKINNSYYIYDHIGYDLGYIDIMAGGVFYPTEKLKFEAALVPSFKISESIRYTYLGNDLGKTNTNSLKSFDLGAMLGLHYRFTDELSFGLSYNMGLSNIADKSKDSTFTNLKNRSFLINVSYKIDL